MEPRSEDEKLIARYLLEELSEEEQVIVEERFFTDNDFFERLQIVKDELMDDYVQDRLSEPERERFESHFLRTPQRQREVELTRALVRTVTEASAVEPTPPVVNRPEPVSGWSSFRPAFRWAMAAAMLLAVLSSAWFIRQTSQLRAQLAQLEAGLQAAQHREQELEQQLAEHRADRDQLAQQLEHAQAEQERLEQELANLSSSRPSVLSFLLFPTLRFRSEAGRPKLLDIPVRAQAVELKLVFEPEDDYTSYRVKLRRRGGDEVLWRQDGMRARSAAQGHLIVLRIQAGILTEGDYRLRLEGELAEDEWEKVDDYAFRVAIRH